MKSNSGFSFLSNFSNFSDFLILAISVLYIYFKINNVNEQFRQDMNNYGSELFGPPTTSFSPAAGCNHELRDLTPENVVDNQWVSERCFTKGYYSNALTVYQQNSKDTDARNAYTDAIQQCVTEMCGIMSISSASIASYSYLLSGTLSVVTYILL
jgi:hypothetical protein